MAAAEPTCRWFRKAEDHSKKDCLRLLQRADNDLQRTIEETAKQPEKRAAEVAQQPEESVAPTPREHRLYYWEQVTIAECGSCLTCVYRTF